ncbi:MAG: hypothetical protein H6730_30825 [Deltaproteobacteria bacterium]|nr:hypothetical protein [Deltaproteobacteria bacterium]
MNPAQNAFEGPSLEDSLEAASAALGVPMDELDYRLDRDHFLNGASTVRIFAAPRDPANASIRETLEKFLAEEFTNRELEASARVTVTNGEVKVAIEAQSGVVPDDDASLEALAEVLREVGGEGMADRTLKVLVQLPAGSYAPSERRDRDRGGRDRGGRDRDRGGRDRGGRDRDRRGGGRDRDRGGRDRDRGGRDRDRDRDRGDRPKPEKDPKREAALVAQAKEAIEQVLEDGEAVTIEGLNSYERRIIHRTVAEVDGLTTRSLGRGSLKAVRIFEGEDEDEDDEG